MYHSWGRATPPITFENSPAKLLAMLERSCRDKLGCLKPPYVFHLFLCVIYFHSDRC